MTNNQRNIATSAANDTHAFKNVHMVIHHFLRNKNTFKNTNMGGKSCWPKHSTTGHGSSVSGTVYTQPLLWNS